MAGLQRSAAPRRLAGLTAAVKPANRGPGFPPASATPAALLRASRIYSNRRAATTAAPQWSGIPLLTMLSNAGLLASIAALAWAVGARALGM